MTSTTQTVNQPPSVGAKAPDFTLPTFEGTPFSLREALAKGPVVVAFFPGTFTAPCTEEMCSVSDDIGAYQSLGATVVGVSADSTHSQKVFAEKNDLKVKLASDFDKKTIQAYGVAWESPWGVTAMRSVFVVDRDGVVRWSYVGEKAGVQPPLDEVKAALGKLK